jgi:glycosyltransferase involved in cell wall biosynthesis
MRVLAISPTPSHPQDAGNRARIHALLSALKAAGHAIHLCLLLRENPSPAALEAMRAEWDEVIAVPHDRARERRSLGDLNALDDWILPEAEAAFAELAAREPSFDLVLVEYVFLSRAFEFFPRAIPRVLDTHDIFAGRAARLAALGLENRFFATTREEEDRGLDRADLVLAIQAEEAAELAGRTRAVVMTLGHRPADPRPALPPRDAGAAPAIGYLGSPNPLNTRAFTRFLDAFEGGAELVVAGAAGQALADRPGLTRLGPVADADALYAAVDVVVNPHEGGTGLKIKTVEALARGRPVIGTAEAFAGLPAEAPCHAAADAPAVAHLAARWAADPGFRAEIAAASARLAGSYEAEVRAQQAVLASPAALARLLDRPRALLVTDIPFWRGRLGNHQRIAALVGAARAEMDLDLFFCGTLSPADRGAAGALLGPRGRAFGAGAATPMPAPWGLTPFERERFDGALMASLAAHLARHPVQAAIVQYLRLSWLRLTPGMPALSVLDTHDVMSLREENFRRFGRPHFIRIGATEELTILSRFAAVLAIQPEEAAWLSRALAGRPPLVLHAPHAIAALPRATGSAGPPRIGFLGGDSPMNRDALAWLLDQVWPAIAGRGATLHIAGGVCAAAPAGRAGVTLHGEVEDHHRFLAGLDIAVNPVFYGGGLKIKTVEYLAHGLPSVLSAEALTGIAGGAGEAWLLAPDREAFIAGLASLVADPTLRARMGAAAQGFARRHFGPRALAPAMRVIADLARGTAPA